MFMGISVFDLFSIGIGPSSSHTVGPMRAAKRFLTLLQENKLLTDITTVKVDLYGSLALTGHGHGTDLAIMLGLEGETPEGIDPASIKSRIAHIKSTGLLNLGHQKEIPFKEGEQLLFHKEKQLPYHPNGMRFTAYPSQFERTYYSVGGGFVVDHQQAKKDQHLGDTGPKLPYLFSSGDELLSICEKKGFSIAEVMIENEKTWRSEEMIYRGLLNIWDVMQKCIERGCHEGGILPGGLNIKRRAEQIYKKLTHPNHIVSSDEVMLWVSLWALAVNEENAAGGRVVTAPTNGAAGIIPAVMKYYMKFCHNPSEKGIITFMLTAGAIGILYKKGASISAAEMGCMGEVGVACSMAAAGLTAALGGTPLQVENAAEIGMEHNLGLTCDPIKGLVQIPCIERNTMGSVKAINAALLAMQGDGTHFVSLDSVIATMRETGKNMQSIYKETSLGGLAVNVPEC